MIGVWKNGGFPYIVGIFAVSFFASNRRKTAAFRRELRCDLLVHWR